MTIEIRPTAPEEFRTAEGVVATALLFPVPTDESWSRFEPSWHEKTTFSAWDGDRCIGSCGQFVVDTTVPGGARLGTGAVSGMGVLPTDRRRGAATGIMHALIRDANTRGLPLMSLRAAETAIYGRFGFGLAGDVCTVEIDADRAGPVAGADTAGSFRIVPPDEIIDVVPPLYDRVAHRRPGVVTRPPSWWRRYLGPAIDRARASHVVVHLDASGTADGYAHYDVAWDEPGPGSHGTVRDLFAATHAAELALWQYLFDVDLVTRWRASERPVDDLVRDALADPRAYLRQSTIDEQWIRIVDADVALGARSYQPAKGSVTIQARDALLRHNDGTWRVSAVGAVRSNDAPDLTVDIATLSAAYLGGTSWWSLAATGRVDVHDPDAVARADALFACRPLPFCGSFF